MIAAIHQPQYIPWAGYMNKLANADIFVFLDTVQYKKNEWQNRNRIKTASGWQWITVPVHYRYPEKISEIKIHDKVPWRKKHWQSLVTNYSRAPYFHEYADFFHDTLNRKWELLTDLNIHITEFLADAWDLKAEMARASRLGVDHKDPTTRLAAICKELGADTYLCGKHGPKYMNIAKFCDSGINIIFQEFHSGIYPQLFEGFTPDLSSIDMLFNCGPEGKKVIGNQLDLKKGERNQLYECVGDRRSS